MALAGVEDAGTGGQLTLK